MPKKIIYVLLLVSVAWSANTLHSQPRVVERYSNGEISGEAIDLSICLETEAVEGDPDHVDAREKYEEIIKFWADIIYEMSNGGNYLGTIRIFSGRQFKVGCDVIWRSSDGRPSSTSSGLKNDGQLFFYDSWSKDYRSTEKLRFDWGATLAHESMHYIYGLKDEYGTIDFVASAQNWWFKNVKTFTTHAIPLTNQIIIQTTLEYPEYAYKMGWFETYVPNQQIIVDVGLDEDGVRGTLPEGLITGGTYFIDKVDVHNDVHLGSIQKDGKMQDVIGHSIAITLKDGLGNPIAIKDNGSGLWGVKLMSDYYGATAHTISNSQWYLGNSKYNNCASGSIKTQWQWANFSTAFNLNPYSKQALAFRDVRGNKYSAWDVLVKNPVYDQMFLGHELSRYWFKSLIGREPTKNDIYATTTTYLNYDEDTGKWDKSSKDWNNAQDICASKPTTIKFMKIELEGKTESQLNALSRKHLDIQWIDKDEAEVIVILDRSKSMDSYKKMEQARIAAEYVTAGFSKPNGATSYLKSVKGKILAFNTRAEWIYDSGNSEINRQEVQRALHSVTPSGRTALYDAIAEAIHGFSNRASSLKLLYVISDGKNNEGVKTLKEIVNLYKSRDIAIHTFAYGEDAQRDLLAKMANETGGTFYDQQEQLELNAVNAATTVASGSLGYEQIASLALTPSSESNSIFVPQTTDLIRVYGFYTRTASSTLITKPITIFSADGDAYESVTNQQTVGNKVYFTVDISPINSDQYSSLIKVRNNLSSEEMSIRILSHEVRNTYGMQVNISPERIFNWPVEGKISASIYGINGAFAGISATGSLIDPQGEKHTFGLFDDGSNGDDIPEDGIYHGILPPISENGTYQWEVSLHNLAGRAHSTRIGTSLDNNEGYTPYEDHNPFSFVRNGQFVVNGCCLDEPENSPTTLTPEEIVSAALAQSQDIDKFKIIGTKANNNYVLTISSTNLTNIDKVELYTNNNLLVPAYSMRVEPDGNVNTFSIPLTAELSRPGTIISVVGKNNSHVTIYNMLLLETNFTSFAIGGFESNLDWTSNNTTLIYDNNKKSQGNQSLLTPAGWRIIDSRKINTADFEMIGKKMNLDIYVPSSSVNYFWIGTVELRLVVPSSNKNILIGAQNQISPNFGRWTTYEFDMPDEAINIFMEPHSDARFQIVLNTADSLWIDNLRFSGDMVVNTINQFVMQCPYEQGCRSSVPMLLSLNESIRVIPEGDLWVEIINLPTDWLPAKLFIALSAEDGAELTGHVEFEGEEYALSEWYKELSFNYVLGKRYLFRLSNLGGRPYRINAWVSGEIVDVAKKPNMMKFSNWNVIF